MITAVSAMLTGHGSSLRSLPARERRCHATTGRSSTFQLHIRSMTRPALPTTAARLSRLYRRTWPQASSCADHRAMSHGTAISAVPPCRSTREISPVTTSSSATCSMTSNAVTRSQAPDRTGRNLASEHTDAMPRPRATAAPSGTMSTASACQPCSRSTRVLPPPAAPMSTSASPLRCARGHRATGAYPAWAPRSHLRICSDRPAGAGVPGAGAPGLSCSLAVSQNSHILATSRSLRSAAARRRAGRRTAMGAVTYSIVIPVFNEEEILPELVRRLRGTLDALDGPAEVILVDDGSSDGSYRLMAEANERDPRFKVLQLSRNFGHQLALTAGLDVATGQAVVAMDADLQDPPEVIPELARRWREGYEVVYAVRERREGETLFKRGSARLFYGLLHRLADVDQPVEAGDFRLVDRKALDAFLLMRESNRYVRGMFSWVGFRQASVGYTRASRHAGSSKYPLRKMIR